MNIFVVVGSQIPFDRLVSALDKWAGIHNEFSFFGQIGKSNYIPEHFQFVDKLNALDFNRIFTESDIIISHAGMGVIFKAMENNKPIIVLPRLADLHECTTDHQLATARELKKLDYIHVAMNIDEMLQFLDNPLNIKSKHTVTSYASDQLINTLADFFSNA